MTTACASCFTGSVASHLWMCLPPCLAKRALPGPWPEGPWRPLAAPHLVQPRQRSGSPARQMQAWISVCSFEHARSRNCQRLFVVTTKAARSCRVCCNEEYLRGEHNHTGPHSPSRAIHEQCLAYWCRKLSPNKPRGRGTKIAALRWKTLPTGLLLKFSSRTEVQTLRDEAEFVLACRSVNGLRQTAELPVAFI